MRHRFHRIVLLLLVAVAVAAGPAAAAPQRDAGAPPSFAGTKRHLLSQSAQLVGFTADFRQRGERYYALAKAAGFDYGQLWQEQPAQVRALLRDTKRLWIAGNPMYERMEGIVAGVPSLARYDVILDAGSSRAEDPASAVPFDLDLPDGRTLRQPGNLYNITEGALWGTRPEYVAKGVRPDLDGDGSVEFGEVLPDAAFMYAASRAFDRYARELQRSARAWKPTTSDAFTALVVMVPTMREYFGQWKESRFVAGAKAKGDAFNVVSRLNDIGDILAGLRVVYTDVRPVIAGDDPAQARQTGSELTQLHSFIQKLRAQERSGKHFTTNQAEILGRQAQDRGSAVAGQISQSASALGVDIEQ